jgi:hypothetical protein
MSRSIDPRCPWFLNAEQSALVNNLPCITKLKEQAARLDREDRAEQYLEAVKRLRNEKQRQRRLMLRDIIEKYKKEQPVIDSER